MKNFAELVSEIIKSASAETSADSNSLSIDNSSPTISTDLGVALLKTASALKEAAVEVSYEDLQSFIERNRNV